MGRPLSGSVRRAGDAWEASVPIKRGSRQRVCRNFTEETEARAWLDAQVARINDGLDAEAPAPPPPSSAPDLGSNGSATPGSVDGPFATFEEYAYAWHQERYIQLHGANAEGSAEIRRNLELHILPAFGGPLETDVQTGRARVVGWTRRMAGYPADPDGPDDEAPGRTYAADTVNGQLWILTEVLRYASTLGAEVAMASGRTGPTPAITNGIGPISPRGRSRRKPTLVTLATTRRIASDMHVVHQLVLWVMRIAGLRIGEVYGLNVSNFIPGGDHGLLLIEDQGGRSYPYRDDDEQVRTTDRKQNPKTDAGYRLIALPDSLTALIWVVIRAFHTDPETGEVDTGARLVPTIRARGGGQAGFRNSLKRAASGLQDASADPEAYVIAHDFRKAFATDLAWQPELDNLVKRRAMGHRAGSDVYDLVYTLDDRLGDAMRPAAEEVEAEIQATIGSLVTPTAQRPQYASGLCAHRLAHADAVLAEVGWQVDTCGEGWVTTDEAAAMLGMAPSSTRRLLSEQHLPAIKKDGEWQVHCDEVLSYRHRHDGEHTIDGLAEEIGRSYHATYQTMERLGIEPSRDERVRQLFLTAEQANELRAEFSRLDALYKRSVTVAGAASTLRNSDSTIRKWAREGRLTYDTERDAAGARYVSRTSIDAELARRGSQRRRVVTRDELKEYTGLDATAIKALLDAGHLVRDHRGYTLASVRRWATGYRPDLLDTPLLPAL